VLVGVEDDVVKVVVTKSVTVFVAILQKASDLNRSIDLLQATQKMQHEDESKGKRVEELFS
jgi:hypothetical protein